MLYVQGVEQAEMHWGSKTFSYHIPHHQEHNMLGIIPNDEMNHGMIDDYMGCAQAVWHGVWALVYFTI